MIGSSKYRADYCHIWGLVGEGAPCPACAGGPGTRPTLRATRRRPVRSAAGEAVAASPAALDADIRMEAGHLLQMLSA